MQFSHKFPAAICLSLSKVAMFRNAHLNFCRTLRADSLAQESPSFEKTASSPRSYRVRENGLLSPALSSRGGEGDALRLLGACYKQVTPNGVCCGSGVQSAKFHFGEISLRPSPSEEARGRAAYTPS